MGLFDFVTNVVSATVKVAISPVAIAKDVYNVVTDQEVDVTKNLLESAGDDLSDAADEIIP